MLSQNGNTQQGLAFIPIIIVASLVGAGGYVATQTDWGVALTGTILKEVLEAFSTAASSFMGMIGVETDTTKIDEAINYVNSADGVFYYLNPWFPTQYAITLGLLFITFLAMFGFAKLAVKLIPTIG